MDAVAGLIDALVVSERLVRCAQAVQLRILGELDAQRAREDDPAAGFIDSEVAVALNWSPNVTLSRLYDGGRLVQHFPETLALLASGDVSLSQVRALLEITGPLDPEVARAVQARVLPRMPGQCTATTRKALHRAVLAVDPEAVAKRHREEVARRRVVLRPEADGMASVELYTSAQCGVAVMNALTHCAGKREPGDARSIDQRRADALVRLVLDGVGVRAGGTQSPDSGSVAASGLRIPALVHVTVGIDTLMGANQEPAEVRGYGPVGAAQVRELAFAPGSVWRRLLTAPDGELLHVDPRTYRPTASVARLVRERDRHCAFPTCSMPAERCDLDHVVPFNHRNPAAGGATIPENLHALCRRHHRLKTAGMWTPTRNADGSMVWKAASGRTYSTRPPSYAAV